MGEALSCSLMEPIESHHDAGRMLGEAIALSNFDADTLEVYELRDSSNFPINPMGLAL
ncbi:MAG: hypothetical protein ACP5NY_07365 [Thermocladium sp.]